MTGIGKLFQLGDKSLLGKSYKKVAVVGSRRMTEYGRRAIEKIIPGLVEAGVVIVSGFMYGVDQEAHRACIASGGKTIAVLGWGIDWSVPEDDRALYKSILETGLLVSEYKAKTAPALWMFPQRNRIVAALADAVMVIEAAEKSGSLITARLAIEQKKKLFCLPGPVTSGVSVGTNELIKTGAARMVTRAEDILRELGIDTPSPRGSGASPSTLEGEKIERAILSALENEGLLLDEIIRKIHEPISKVGPVMSLLELRGAVKSVNGRYYLV